MAEASLKPKNNLPPEEYAVKWMGNMELVEVDKKDAVTFVQKYHYSQIMPRLTKHYLGVLNRNGEIESVVTLGWGTQPLQTIQKIFPGSNYKSQDYLEIGKMCFRPELNNSNYGSQFISALVRWMKQNTNCSFLYTLADGIMGKCGYVYQASNFVYVGSFKTSVYYDRETGEKIHPRSAAQLCKENAQFCHRDKIYWLTYDFCEHKKIDKIQGLMFRYILPLNKVAKGALQKQYASMKYPKDEDLYFERRVSNGKFERIPQPVFNMRVFTYNYQKGAKPVSEE